MKILLTVDPEIPVPPGMYGGIERIVEVLIDEYLAKGHNVTLCANPASKVPCTLISWKGLRSQRLVDIIKNAFTLTSIVYTQKFDVVHSFSRLAYMTAILPLKIPKIMSYQREPSLSQIQKASALARKGSFAVTGCSNYIANQVKSVAEAHTIYNFAPIEKYDFVNHVSLDAPLVFLGRIEEIKGTHIAIEIAQKSGRRLIIAGNIPIGKEAYFEAKVKPFLNSQIQYVGPVNDEQKNNYLGSAAAFLMPIQWNEPFGIVMAEAMACGTPVIGFPYGSVPEIVQNGMNGFVCNTVEEMVVQINNLATINRAHVRKIAEEKFSSKVIAEKYLKLYEMMIIRK